MKHLLPPFLNGRGSAMAGLASLGLLLATGSLQAQNPCNTSGVTPVANPDQLTATSCQALTFSATDLLGNDTDPQGNSLEIAEVLQPSSGSITDNGNGTYTYYPASGSTANVSFSYVVKKNDQTVGYSGNNHFYEYVSSPYICWYAAKAEAESRSYYGMQGYLATITSAGENAFAASKLEGNGWIGGSDDQQEGVWRWQTGPEAGQQFWQGLWYGYATGYHNWAGGEPNNAGGENFAHFYAGAGNWNDLPNCHSWIMGYVVEYGGMENCTPVLTSTGTATISFVAPAPIQVNTQNITVYLNAAGNATIAGAQVDNGSFSPCGISSLSVSPNNFSCANEGANTVTLTVTDGAGRTSTGTATVTVVGLTGVGISASQTTIDYGNSATLTANAASTQTYYISSANLQNVWDCWNGSMYGYGNTGFNWQDNGSGTVTNIEIQYSEGVNCISYYNNYYSNWYGYYSTSIPTSLNGYAGPYVSATNDWCDCSPTYTEQIKTVNFSYPSGYVSGGINYFAVNAGGPEYGFIPAASLNGYYAKITVTYGGGANGLTYNWTPGNLTGSSVTVSPTENTTYTLTATSDAGCSSTSTITINVTPPPVAFTLSSSNVSCPTGTDGSISVAATGGNNTFEYAINGGAYGSSNVFSGLAAGTYSVSVKQGTFVAAPQSITVSETPDNTAPSISCSGDVSVVAQPGDCTPSVSWSAPVASDNCSFSVSSSHNSGDRFPVGTTTVTYTATDISGNSTSCSFNVTVSATPLVMSVASPSYNGFNISCNGGSNGSATATVSGGCLPYSYVWSNGATSATASGLTAGTYNVTVTDANGTSVNQSITLTQPSALSVTGGIAPATAYATAQANTIYLGYGPQSRTLSASVSGGVAAYSYNWSPASGLNSTSSASVTASPTASTNYMVTVTDANGCTASNSYALQVIDARCGTANNPKVIVCHNGNEICISANAVPAHLAHGCQVGSCGNARMAEAQEVHQAIFAAYPNPNNGNFTLEVEAATKGEVALELFDMNGRSVSKLFNGSMEAGEHRTFTVNQANLASGIYIVKMQTAGDVSVLQIAVQK